MGGVLSVALCLQELVLGVWGLPQGPREGGGELDEPQHLTNMDCLFHALHWLGCGSQSATLQDRPRTRLSCHRWL